MLSKGSPSTSGEPDDDYEIKKKYELVRIHTHSILSAEM